MEEQSPSMQFEPPFSMGKERYMEEAQYANVRHVSEQLLYSIWRTNNSAADLPPAQSNEYYRIAGTAVAAMEAHAATVSGERVSAILAGNHVFEASAAGVSVYPYGKREQAVVLPLDTEAAFVRGAGNPKVLTEGEVYRVIHFTAPVEASVTPGVLPYDISNTATEAFVFEQIAPTSPAHAEGDTVTADYNRAVLEHTEAGPQTRIVQGANKIRTVEVHKEALPRTASDLSKLLDHFSRVRRR